MDKVLMQAATELVAELLSDAQAAWRKEVEIISAESRALIAELRSQNADLVAALKESASVQAERVSQAVAGIQHGKDADPAETARIVSEQVERAVNAIPAPKDGESVTPDQLAPMIGEAVSKALADLNGLVSEAVAQAVSEIPPAPAGKDADPDAIRSLVREAVAEIPKPADGTSVTVDDLTPLVAEAVTMGLEDLDALVQQRVEAIIAEMPKPQDGKSITVDDVRPVLAEMVAELPAPRDGKNADPEEVRALIAEVMREFPAPKDGTSVTLEDVAPLIERAVEERVSALPAPKDGEPGAMPDIETIRSVLAPLVDEAVKGLPPAEPGAPGKDVDMEQVSEMVQRAVDAMPRRKDGESFTIDQAKPLVDEAVSTAIKALPPVKDGVGLAGAVIDREGNLTVTFSDGRTQQLGQVVGKDADQDAIEARIREEVAKIPVPKDGLDGLGFDDMAVEYDGDRSFVLRWVRGEIEKSCRIELPVVLDRGVFKEGAEYVRGDGVTWGGSYWIAQADTADKPGDGSKSWRLAVKKGRDGKEVVKLQPRDPSTPVKLQGA